MGDSLGRIGGVIFGGRGEEEGSGFGLTVILTYIIYNFANNFTADNNNFLKIHKGVFSSEHLQSVRDILAC